MDTELHANLMRVSDKTYLIKSWPLVIPAQRGGQFADMVEVWEESGQIEEVEEPQCEP